MTLYLHRAERADRLVTALGDLLSTPLIDLFATEIISVPTHGVERWLSQGRSGSGLPRPQRRRLCRRGLPSPRRLVARAIAGSAEEEDADPWQPHRAVWPLLRVIDACRGEPWAALLWHYLGGNGRSTEQDPPYRTALVDRAASGRPVRQVRHHPTDNDRQLVPRQRRRRPGDPRFPPTVPGRPNSGGGCAMSLLCRARPNVCKTRLPGCGDRAREQ